MNIILKEGLMILSIKHLTNKRYIRGILYMEYSKDIILGIKYPETRKKGQAEQCNKKMFNFLKKHKGIATISIICGILMILDCILVHNFIVLLQTLA